MQIIRYADEAGVRVGVQEADDVRPLPVPALADLLALPASRLREFVASAASAAPSRGRFRLLPPVDGLTEVWASGVTYQRSSAARQEESQVADVYARVYDADRPELFFKSPAWRVCGPGEPIGIRPDSAVNVPEPELAVVCNAAGRDRRRDHLQRRVVPVHRGREPAVPAAGQGLRRRLRARARHRARLAARRPAGADDQRDGRAAAAAWPGTARPPPRSCTATWPSLVDYLFRRAQFPHGAVLSTGTGLVPELDFTLEPGDVVRIDIAGIGSLTNIVRPATVEWFGWLTPAPDRAPRTAAS